MPELPPLPEPKLYPSGTYPDGVLTYSADQMQAYAAQYGQVIYAHCQDVRRQDMQQWHGQIVAIREQK